MSQDVQVSNFYSPKNDAFYENYEYLPLDSTQKEVRLLELVPAETADENIECALVENDSLADAHDRYLAISYFAGDPTNTVNISVNGLPFNVFANLATAVKRLRRPKTEANKRDYHQCFGSIRYASILLDPESNTTET